MRLSQVAEVVADGVEGHERNKCIENGADGHIYAWQSAWCRRRRMSLTMW